MDCRKPIQTPVEHTDSKSKDALFEFMSCCNVNGTPPVCTNSGAIREDGIFQLLTYHISSNSDQLSNKCRSQCILEWCKKMSDMEKMAAKTKKKHRENFSVSSSGLDYRFLTDSFECKRVFLAAKEKKNHL